MSRRQRLTLLAAVCGSAVATIDGAVVSGALGGSAFAANQHSVRAFHEAMLICAALFVASAAIGAIGMADPRRHLDVAACAGGRLVGAPQASLPQQA
jgi:hypothetical protein